MKRLQMNDFEQNNLLNKIKIEFQETGILYAYGNFISNKQIFIEYENIEFRKVTREKKIDKFNLFICIASGLTVLKCLLGIYDNPYGIYKGLLPLAAIFFAVFSVVTWLGWVNLVYINTTEYGPIKLYDQKPDKKSLDEFLKNLKNHVKSYLKVKYTQIDVDISPEHQLENLYWLRSSNIITKQEYEELKAKFVQPQS